MARGGRRRNSGPLPDSPELKLIKGSRKRPAKGKQVELQRGRIPTCPAQLSDGAKAEWRRVAPELHQRGLLTALDRAALAAYCTCVARVADYERELAKYVDEPPPASLVRAHGQVLALMQRYAAEFGMTPASRSRVRAVPPEPMGADEAFLRLLDN